MKQELSQKPPFSRFLAVLISAGLMTVIFTFLGTPLVRVLRNAFGSKRYWVAGILFSGFLVAVHLNTFFAGISLLSFWVTIGIYQEFEERGHANFWTALLSVSLGSAVLIVVPVLWTQSMGINLVESLKMSLEDLAKQFLKGRSLSEQGINPETVVGLIPSAVVVTHTAALAFALILDRPLAFFFGLRYERIASHLRLLEFRLPDAMIWITMFSFLFGFTDYAPHLAKVISMNVFIILMGLYFFQGFAVMEMSFLAFRLGPIMRFLIYFFIVGQLFPLLSLVGLIDYWVDFRQRLKRWKLSERSQNNGDNL